MGKWFKFSESTLKSWAIDPFETQDIFEEPATILSPAVKFKLLHKDAIVPTRRFYLDAGLDVYALQTTYIAARRQAIIRTGIALADAPSDCVIQLWSKSGLDANLCLHVGAGIIDPNYRGEILVLLKNMGNESVGINKGDAIAQLVIVQCMRPDIEIVSEVEATDRGEQGGINEVERD